jgi:hypothetical protein
MLVRPEPNAFTMNQENGTLPPQESSSTDWKPTCFIGKR